MLSKLRETRQRANPPGGCNLGFLRNDSLAHLCRGAGESCLRAGILPRPDGYVLGQRHLSFGHGQTSCPANFAKKSNHSAIFLLIAGTYTPFCLLAFKGFWHWGLLALIWAIAAIGIVVKVFYIKSPRWLHTSIYIGHGLAVRNGSPADPSVCPGRYRWTLRGWDTVLLWGQWSMPPRSWISSQANLASMSLAHLRLCSALWPISSQ